MAQPWRLYACYNKWVIYWKCLVSPRKRWMILKYSFVIINLSINILIPAYVNHPNENPNYLGITIHLLYGLENNDLRVFLINTNIWRMLNLSIARFGGSEFPPMIYFKIFINAQGQKVKYMCGRKAIKPATEVLLISYNYYESNYIIS